MYEKVSGTSIVLEEKAIYFFYERRGLDSRTHLTTSIRSFLILKELKM